MDEYKKRMEEGLPRSLEVESIGIGNPIVPRGAGKLAEAPQPTPRFKREGIKGFLEAALAAERDLMASSGISSIYHRLLLASNRIRAYSERSRVSSNICPEKHATAQSLRELVEALISL
jgi:hypothetical protein